MDKSKSNIELKNTHESKFFSVGLKHRVHIQRCHYPESNPPDGVFIFLEKEIGYGLRHRLDMVNFMLHKTRDKEGVDLLFDNFDSQEAEQYAKKLSPRTKWVQTNQQ